MSSILKAGHVADHVVAPSVFHMRDLYREAQQVIEAARNQAEHVLSEARREGRRLGEEACQQGFQKGHEEGLAKGREEGHQAAFSEAEARFNRDHKHLTESLSSIVKEVSEARAECLHAAERDLLDFAIRIAKRVAKSVGRLNREVAQANLHESLSLVVGKSDVVVKVHPDDLSSLKRFADELIGEVASLPHMTFSEDASLSPGGIQLMTDDGGVDASLEQQIEQITSALTSVYQE